MTDTVPRIKLYLKCSAISPDHIGACLMSQKWFMVFFTLVNEKMCVLEVSFVDLKNKDFNDGIIKDANKLPLAAIVSGKELLNLSEDTYDNDESIELLMTAFKAPWLGLESSAFKTTENLFSSFRNGLRTNNFANISNNLKKLDDFISSRNMKFLQGNEIRYIDCVVMPKLQHIRVIMEEFKQFQIPNDYCALWGYLKSMYNNEAFRISCPHDNDLYLHYLDKTNPMPKKKYTLMKELVQTFTVPAEFQDEETNEEGHQKEEEEVENDNTEEPQNLESSTSVANEEVTLETDENAIENASD